MAWYNESKRHSDAAKGRKTGHRTSASFNFKRKERTPQLYSFHFAIGRKHGYEGKEKITPLFLAKAVANFTHFGFNTRPQQYVEKEEKGYYLEKSVEFSRGGMTMSDIRKVKEKLPYIARRFHQKEIFEEAIPEKESNFIQAARAHGASTPMGV